MFKSCLSLFKNFLFVLLFFHLSWTFAQNIPSAESRGPEKGALFIGGGGMTEELWNVFLELAGGEEARLVVIPTAFDENSINYDPDFEILDRQFRARGFTHIQFMHTRDSLLADTDEFAKPLKFATAVWLMGGRQWRLADAYLGTKTNRALQAVLARGGVIGGESAGASIQGSYLARGGREPNGGYQIMGDPDVGFGFISNIAIDQHHLERNRQYDMFELLEIRPELLGVGIDKNTAIVVQGDEFEVVGDRYVGIYDGTFWSPYFNKIDESDSGKDKFYFLQNGDKYNLKERRVQLNKFLKPAELSPEKKQEFVGDFLYEKSQVFWHNIVLENETLKFQIVRRNIVRDPIPIYPYSDDLFFDIDAELWFHFIRDGDGKVVGFEKQTHQWIDGQNQLFNKVEE